MYEFKIGKVFKFTFLDFGILFIFIWISRKWRVRLAEKVYQIRERQTKVKWSIRYM